MSHRRVPTCGHPERDHYEKDKCRECAGAESARVPECGHPGRKHYAKGLCFACYAKVWQKPWRVANRAKLALDARARVHGLRPQELRDLWKAQGGACANPRCDAVFDLEHSDHRNGLQIDHCHATGKVRGLLCKSCNTALGHINDDLERLRGLIEYMEALN